MLINSSLENGPLFEVQLSLQLTVSRLKSLVFEPKDEFSRNDQISVTDIHNYCISNQTVSFDWSGTFESSDPTAKFQLLGLVVPPINPFS